MKTLSATLVVLSTLPCWGDEIVLRDGKRLSWKTLTAEGDSYIVESEDGRRLTIRKAEIERITIAREPVGVPLAGANFVIDKKTAVVTDLLPKAEVGTSPDWKLVGRALVATSTWPARSVLTFDHELPEEYDLALVVERVGNGQKDFAVGLSAAGGAVCAYHFDAWDASRSVLALISGQESEPVSGKVFQPNRARTVKISVRKDAVAVHVDGKEFWKSRIDWRLVSPHPAVMVRDRTKPFVVASGGTWKVSMISVTAAGLTQAK